MSATKFLAAGVACWLCAGAVGAEVPLRVATFEADVTPPLGTPLCDALVPPAREIVDPLKARGVVLFSAEGPVVLCALDWVGVGNSGHDAFRMRLAQAAGTGREWVAVHCLHAHDAPGCDFAADDLLTPHGLGGRLFDPVFAATAIERVADAVREACKRPSNVTHIGLGKGRVENVASNRRILGPDGRVAIVRYSKTTDPKARAAPEGTIDPFVHLVSFWDGEKPIASLTYYATHPQSYYGRGGVSCDFPGLARGRRDREQPGVFHVHFNGAGGNVTAGKYNDGAPENRPVLARRLADGMKRAWESAKRQPIAARDVKWRVSLTTLPDAPHLDRKTLAAAIANVKLPDRERLRAARDLAYLNRNPRLDICCLRVGPAFILHMPGELFVEYQLAAQRLRPDAPVMMAAYGDYGTGYIGLKQSYAEGGYETGPVSRVAPEAEGYLMTAIRELLAGP